MLLNGDKLHEAVSECRRLFDSINKDKLHLGYILNELVPIFKDYKLVNDYGSFKQFLAEFGKSDKQVLELMEAARYVKENKIDELPAFYLLPTTKYFLLSKLKVKWSHDMFETILDMPYSEIKNLYGNNN